MSTSDVYLAYEETLTGRLRLWSDSRYKPYELQQEYEIRNDNERKLAWRAVPYVVEKRHDA